MSSCVFTNLCDPSQWLRCPSNSIWTDPHSIPSTLSWPPKHWGAPAGVAEIACAYKRMAQVGLAPGLIGGSAHHCLRCYKASAGLRTPRGPRFRTWV